MLYQKGWSSILPLAPHVIPWSPLGCVVMPGMAAGSSFGVFVPVMLKSCLLCFSLQRLQDRGFMPQPPNLTHCSWRETPFMPKGGQPRAGLRAKPISKFANTNCGRGSREVLSLLGRV